ncbi:hypothetical protein NLJ89_g10600 [Agrocybe chaxingu]|uniref:Uncharacterized protein n=1 Tax=Agrocybe chaxingu TaxID=84603 RepID=A0A9W8MSG6_9AGAR|nr:hypothetical protein NLJ89_g10600 [Agrocybe chaxingu]
MLAFDARFTLLAALSTLAIQSFSPISAASAAAIARAPSPDAGSPPSQNFLPYRRLSTHEVRTARSFHTFSPFSRIADVLFAYATQSQDASRRKSHARRRTNKPIVIPNDHGSNYVVSHRRAATPQWGVKSQSNNTGIPGTVAVMTSRSDSPGGQSIASLFLTNMNGTYILNASDTNKTQLYLVDASSSTSTNSSTDRQNSTKVVKMCIPFSDLKWFCATYNPNPPKAEPLTMEESFDPASVTASQLFE